MRPEVAALFRMAMRHEDLSREIHAPTSVLDYLGYWRRRNSAERRIAKHRRKAQRLYHKAAVLDAREYVR